MRTLRVHDKIINIILYNISNTNEATYYLKSCSNSIFLEPTNEIELFKIIMSLRNTNAVGYDCISTKLIKTIAKHITQPLAHIINLSLEQGVFPEKLKLSQQLPSGYPYTYSL